MVDAASLGARHGASLLTQLKTERPSDIIKTRYTRKSMATTNIEIRRTQLRNFPTNLDTSNSMATTKKIQPELPAVRTRIEVHNCIYI